MALEGDTEQQNGIYRVTAGHLRKEKYERKDDSENTCVLPLVNVMTGKSMDKCIVYGERPITELSLTMMTDEDLGRLVSGIELSDGGRIPFDESCQLQHVFVEAPLGRQFGVIDIVLAYDDFSVLCEVKPADYDSICRRLEVQIPRYLDSLGREPSLKQTALVRLVRKMISGKKIYLIAMTSDTVFPPKLRDFYKGLGDTHAVCLGWASYANLSSVLEKEGFVIEGTSANLWARKRP